MPVYPCKFDPSFEELFGSNSVPKANSTSEMPSFASVPKDRKVTSLQDCPIVMTPIEAARILGCGRNSIYNLLKSGQLKSVRVGKLIKITKSAIEEYLQMR